MDEQDATRALYLHIVLAHEDGIFLSSPIRTIPSALELPQILPLHTKSGSRALPPIRN